MWAKDRKDDGVWCVVVVVVIVVITEVGKSTIGNFNTHACAQAIYLLSRSHCNALPFNARKSAPTLFSNTDTLYVESVVFAAFALQLD